MRWPISRSWHQPSYRLKSVSRYFAVTLACEFTCVTITSMDYTYWITSRTLTEVIERLRHDEAEALADVRRSYLAAFKALLEQTSEEDLMQRVLVQGQIDTLRRQLGQRKEPDRDHVRQLTRERVRRFRERLREFSGHRLRQAHVRPGVVVDVICCAGHHTTILAPDRAQRAARGREMGINWQGAVGGVILPSLRQFPSSYLTSGKLQPIINHIGAGWITSGHALLAHRPPPDQRPAAKANCPRPRLAGR